MQYRVPAIVLALSLVPLWADPANEPFFRSDVDLVMLTFNVDKGGQPVNGLKASDIEVLEDGVPQRITDFVPSRASAAEKQSRVPVSIFVLVDTSNAMYSGYAYACDAISTFIRGLDPEDYVAVYTFSRNLARSTPLTRDRYQAMAGLQNAAAGDETALYNALLLTLRDAEKVPGPKRVVVFSNGADTASLVSPDDVSRVAEDAGIPIYVVSTDDRDAISVNAWSRITARTGGEAHYAPAWSLQEAAFRAISESIRNAYTVTYYPTSNHPGFRKLRVRIKEKGYRVRCRPGYSAPGKHATLSAKISSPETPAAQ